MFTWINKFNCLLLVFLVAFTHQTIAAKKQGQRWKDSTPDQFQLVSQSNVPLATFMTSNTITITGINTAADISISNGQYSVNNRGYTTNSGIVDAGDLVTVKQLSSNLFVTTTSANLVIGAVSDDFNVTTLTNNADSIPDQFTLIAQTDVEPNTLVTSASIIITGINTASQVTIIGGEFSINGADYTTNGVAYNDDTITVQLLSDSNFSTITEATLSVAGVSDTFSVTTIAKQQIQPASPGNPTFTSEHFSGSANCQRCHDGLTDENGKDVSLVADWKSTMMANSTRDPFWKAKVRSELNRSPVLADVINDKCSRCHAPMANFEAKKNHDPIKIFDDGFLNASNIYHDRAMDGVSCTLCHQIKDSPNLGTLESFTGNFEIDSYTNAVDRKIYGPYNNIFAGPMRNNVSYSPEYSAHIKESEICATCHNVKTPYTDEDGKVLSDTPENEFPEQMPYSEWLHSDFAGTKSCQQCHMARANGVIMSSRPSWLSTQRDDFAEHTFVGGNILMLDILQNNKEQLGVLANNFSEIIAGSKNLMQGAASIKVINPSQSTGTLSFTLRIDSHTGHKLPTSYPSRRVILHVIVKDSLGNTVFESGKINVNGSVANLDSDANLSQYEPHYDLITTADQVQVYEAIMQDNTDNVTYTLLRGMDYLKDNRLLPSGFNKQTAPLDIKVAGNALEDINFTGGSDEISFQIADLSADTYSIKVELVYQTLSYAFAQDLFTDKSEEVNSFKQMFDASKAKSSTITATEFVISP